MLALLYLPALLAWLEKLFWPNAPHEKGTVKGLLLFLLALAC